MVRRPNAALVSSQCGGPTPRWQKRNRSSFGRKPREDHHSRRRLLLGQGNDERLPEGCHLQDLPLECRALPIRPRCHPERLPGAFALILRSCLPNAGIWCECIYLDRTSSQLGRKTGILEKCVRIPRPNLANGRTSASSPFYSYHRLSRNSAAHQAHRLMFLLLQVWDTKTQR